MARPITAPRNVLPPKTRAAEIATITGRYANAVLATMSKKSYHDVLANSGYTLPIASTNPIMRPDATIAGKIGTKTSPTAFNILFHKG